MDPRTRIPSSTVRTIEIKLKRSGNKSFKTVLLQPKQDAKTAVKRCSCCSQSRSVSAVYAKLLSLMLSIKL